MSSFQESIKTMRKNKELIQLFRFGIVGVLNTALDFFIFTILIYFFNIKPSISQGISYSMGTLNSFIFNKKWTFKGSETSNTKLQALRFIVINGISLALSSVSVNYLITDIHINKLLAKVVVTILTQVINYLGYKLIVFK